MAKQEKKTIKLFYSSDAVHKFIKDLKKKKETFTLAFTGYTCLITTEKSNFFFVKDNAKNSFATVQKIKGEIIKSGIWVDEMATDKIKYFRVNNLNNQLIKEVYNVDINAAYPTALYNLGFITKDLFDELQKMDKIKKLKSIGQLATKKTVFEFEKGEQVKVYSKYNEQMRNVWFAICNEVGEAVEECKVNINSFLFYWFDGIYFTDKSEAEKIIQMLKNRKFESKFEVLKNFKVETGTDNVFISYLKEGKEKNFQIPKSEKIVYS